MKVPTAHNEAKYGDIAKTVIMPGDPLRAKYIAEHYLTDVVCYNDVRAMYGYTGMYKGHRISIQGSGMGIPSMAIYCDELFNGYGVDNIIRIGSAGTLSSDIEIRDIIIASSAQTDSNYVSLVGLDSDKPVGASEKLLNISKKITEKMGKKLKYGKVFTSLIFYNDPDVTKSRYDKDLLAIEMETVALYANAVCSNKNALAMFTISDNPVTGVNISSEERELGFNEMIKTVLEIAINIENEE